MAIGNDTRYGKILAEWLVPEYIKYKHFFGWYVLGGSLGVALLIHALVTLNFLFAIIISLSAVIIILHELRTPHMLDFFITEEGVVLGDNFYSYKDLETFWIVYNPPETEILYFGLKKTLRAELPIHLEQQNPIVIRKILLNYIPEDLEREELATDEQLSKMLKL